MSIRQNEMNKILTIFIATVISMSAMFAQEAGQDAIPVYDSGNAELRPEIQFNMDRLCRCPANSGDIVI